MNEVNCNLYVSIAILIQMKPLLTVTYGYMLKRAWRNRLSIFIIYCKVIFFLQIHNFYSMVPVQRTNSQVPRYMPLCQLYDCNNPICRQIKISMYRWCNLHTC